MNTLRLLLGLATIAIFLPAPSCKDVSYDVVYAQTVPASLSIAWDDPTVTQDNVIAFNIYLDAVVTPQRQAVTCTAGTCTGALTVPTFGPHTWGITAVNLKVTGSDVAIEQESTRTAGKPFTLNPAPTAVSNGKVVK